MSSGPRLSWAEYERRATANRQPPVIGLWSIVVTDELGQVVARRYEPLTGELREQARTGDPWAVVRAVLDDEREGAA